MSLSKIVNPAATLPTVGDGVGGYTQPVVDQKGVTLVRSVDANGVAVGSANVQDVVNATTGKTQANGVFTVSPYAAGRAAPYSTTIGIECSATPSAGTLLVEYRLNGMTTWVTASTVNLVSSPTTISIISGYPFEFRFTPTSFDADKTYSVTVVGKG